MYKVIRAESTDSEGSPIQGFYMIDEPKAERCNVFMVWSKTDTREFTIGAVDLFAFLGKEVLFSGRLVACVEWMLDQLESANG